MANSTNNEASVTVQTQYVPMPAHGLQALAAKLWPDDADKPYALTAHVNELWLLNTDTLRDETSFRAGQQVRVPVL